MDFQIPPRNLQIIKEKGNRSCIANPRVSKNHATAHKYYSNEFWLRIWKPGLFLILFRGPSSLSARTEDGGGSPVPVGGWPRRRQGSGGGAPRDHRAPVGRHALLHCRLRLAGHANRSSSGGGSGDGALRRRKRLMQGCHMSSGRRKR